MAGAATSAIFAAAGFVIASAVKFGRQLQRFDHIGERVELLDRKIERHLDWHDEPRLSYHAE
jgi:hypothetical protein